MQVTRQIAKYTKDAAVNLSELSRKTGIEYRTLYKTLRMDSRALRTDEFFKICQVLNINPGNFMVDPSSTDPSRSDP